MNPGSRERESSQFNPIFYTVSHHPDARENISLALI